MDKPGKAERFTAKIDYQNSSGNGIIRMSGGHVDLGPISSSDVGKRVEAVMITPYRAKIESMWIENKNEIDTSHADANGSNESTGSQSSEPVSQSESNIEALRDRAEEESVEEVDVPESDKNPSGKQYNRSQAVKEYVKARADGVCEGCQTPAPFTSKTGEPYLHIHHIFELSNSGSDTPDTVIALCPNCHYRVHHGQDGNEYNQELLTKVQNLESD